jgi:hypothetical protein
VHHLPGAAAEIAADQGWGEESIIVLLLGLIEQEESEDCRPPNFVLSTPNFVLSTPKSRQLQPLRRRRV